MLRFQKAVFLLYFVAHALRSAATHLPSSSSLTPATHILSSDVAEIASELNEDQPSERTVLGEHESHLESAAKAAAVADAKLRKPISFPGEKEWTDCCKHCLIDESGTKVNGVKIRKEVVDEMQTSSKDLRKPVRGQFLFQGVYGTRALVKHKKKKTHISSKQECTIECGAEHPKLKSSGWECMTNHKLRIKPFRPSDRSMDSIDFLAPQPDGEIVSSVWPPPEAKEVWIKEGTSDITTEERWPDSPFVRPLTDKSLIPKDDPPAKKS